jgi:uncharacterized protein
MSDQTLVEPEKLIRSGDALVGHVALASVPEWLERLASPLGEVAWQLSADRDGLERPRLHLALSGDLVLQCQRCLEPMAYRLDHRWDLVVVREESELPDLEDEAEDADCIVAPGAVGIEALVVEELLLALPMMPRHETLACHGPEESGEAEGASPFAVLRALRET